MRCSGPVLTVVLEISGVFRIIYKSWWGQNWGGLRILRGIILYVAVDASGECVVGVSPGRGWSLLVVTWVEGAPV